MPTDKRSAEFELLARLRRSPALRALGCDAVRGLSGSVCLTVAGRAVGAWWCEEGQYRFAQVAYRPHTHETPSAEAAVAASVEYAAHMVGIVGRVD
ncbi:MAG: hypothetical protein RLZ98_1114 [Pseudomonadota bacterium]|jgi:hypothetical protein